MSSGNSVFKYEKLIERTQEMISDLEFDVSSVIIPYSKFIRPVKKSSKNRSIATDSYIKNILRQELL
jgi:hypothetical protein